jgi:hypothetical protein
MPPEIPTCEWAAPEDARRVALYLESTSYVVIQVELLSPSLLVLIDRVTVEVV